MSDHKIGDFVTINEVYRGRRPADAVYEITAVPGGSRKRHQVRNLRTGETISGPGIAFLPYEGERPQVSIVDLPPAMHVGSIVRVKDQPGAGKLPRVPMVVLALASDETARLAVLGGDEGRYWPKIPRSLLDVITLAEAAQG